jgi:galactokinase
VVVALVVSLCFIGSRLTGRTLGGGTLALASGELS